MSHAIAILSYNHPHITKECLDSILKIHGPQNVFLAHNGSLSQHKQFLIKEFPEISHLSLEKNVGFTGGCNFIFKKIFKEYGHQWLYFLTNDTTCISLGKVPIAPGLYAPKIWRRNTQSVDSLGAAFVPKEKKLYHLKEENQFHHLPQGHLPYVPGTAFLIHRNIYEQVGEMDEELHTYWEDVDYSQRALLLKQKLDLWPTFELRHKVGKTCHKDAFYTNYLFQKNRETISLRYT